MALKGLKVGKPIEVTKKFKILEEEIEITFGVLPPGKKMATEIENIFKEFRRADEARSTAPADDEARKAFAKAEEARDAALEGMFLPEKILPYFKYWKGVEAEDGEPLVLTPETFRQVCEEYPAVHAGMVEAMYDAVPRKAEQDRGNSKTSPDTTSVLTASESSIVSPAVESPVIGNA